MQLKRGQQYDLTKRIIAVVAKNVRKVRVEKKYSGKELAHHVNMNVIRFYEFENRLCYSTPYGQTGTNMKLSTLVALAAALEIPLIELFREDPPEEQINPEEDGC